jgi:hypothetical protein
MSKTCSICQEEKPLTEYNKRYLFCKSCQTIRKRLGRMNDDSDFSAITGNVYSLEKLMSSFNEENSDTILGLIEKIRNDLISIKERKPILSLPITIPPAAFQYFKRCMEMGMSLTTMQNRMYIKCDEDYFEETYGVKRPEFIKVSHELSFLIDYIRCLKDAYNQFVEDHNFATRRFDPNFEKIKDIQTFYNFNTQSIEMSDNPLRLDQKTFLRKLRDETQNHHGLTYFHQKHYFDRWYEQFAL